MAGTVECIEGGRMAAISDLVLVHIDNKPAFFSRIEDIVPDVKPGWWQVKLLVLTLPMQLYTWVLDESQINGAAFTMGGTPVLLEKVISPLAKVPASSLIKGNGEGEVAKRRNSPKVVQLFDRKKEEE